MSFWKGGFSEDAVARLDFLMNEFRSLEPGIWVGDAYGPQRDAVSLLLKLDGYNMIVDPNTEKFRVAFFKKTDHYFDDGIVVDTNIADLQKFSDWMKEFLDFS